MKKYPLYYRGVKQQFSKCVVVNNLIFLSGMSGYNLENGEVSSDDMEEQLVTALDNMRSILEEAGSSLENLVICNDGVKHLQDYWRLRGRGADYFVKYAPYLVEQPATGMFMMPVSFAKAKYLVQLDSIAVVSRDKPGWEMNKYSMTYHGVKAAFSRSIVVGNLIFCAGMAGRTMETGYIESDDLTEQLIVALDKTKVAMEVAGSSMDNIVKTTIALKDMNDYQRVREVELEYFRQHAPLLVEEPPASTVVQPLSLANRQRRPYLVEVEAVGVVSRDKPGWRVKTYPLYYGGVKQRFSKCAVVGNLIFLSGMSGCSLENGKVSSDNMEKQLVVALDNIRSILEEAGSSMNDIVKTSIALKDMKDYQRMREVELEYFRQHAPLLVEEPPASTVVQPVSLSKSEYLVEVEAIAVVSR
jgi:2-iminobutanoate/2-iminopropanoate deaminase